LAIRGRRQLQRCPRTIVDEHGHTLPRAPLPAKLRTGSSFQRDRRRPTVTPAALNAPR
jgi:hypothetical protein